MKNSGMHLRMITLAGGFIVLTLAGCSKPPAEAHSEAGGHATHEHVHIAPHGGTLVELREETFNLELVRDREAGKITAYVLDAHAENFVRIPAPEIALTLTTGGERRPLPLRAVGNAMTGETVGNTSQFEAEAPAARAPGELRGEIGPLEIRGGTFGPVPFSLK